MQDGHIRVTVSCVNLNQGYDTHRRGGHTWSKSAPRTVLVTPALLELLRGDACISLSTFEAGDPEPEALDVIAPPSLHTVESLATQEVATLKSQIAREKAAEEIAALKAELEALKAKKAKPPEPPKADDKKSK